MQGAQAAEAQLHEDRREKIGLLASEVASIKVSLCWLHGGGRSLFKPHGYREAHFAVKKQLWVTPARHSCLAVLWYAERQLV